MAEAVALIVAAGRGERAHSGSGEGRPKQYWPLAGKPALRWAVDTFLPLSTAGIRVVIREEDCVHYESAMAGLPLKAAIIGGATRQDSVRLGLEAIAADGPSPDCVLIHDAARPLVSSALIERVLSALDRADAVAPLLRVSDTLRRKTKDGYAIVPRDDLFRAQTPQGFRFLPILDAHKKFADEAFTDDIALAERAGLHFVAVAGEDVNLKLTVTEDFVLAERLAVSALPDVRVGQGFDVHGFVPGDHVFLCGIRVPNDFALEGHSDADAGLHALTDAILGATADADIGAHFPPVDERWRGSASHVFLAHAASLVRGRGGVIAHADVTLICERPKIAPYREAMRARIAEILQIEIARVSVKATTTEGLGFTGRREGLAAQAVATVRLPGR